MSKRDRRQALCVLLLSIHSRRSGKFIKHLDQDLGGAERANGKGGKRGGKGR